MSFHTTDTSISKSINYESQVLKKGDEPLIVVLTITAMSAAKRFKKKQCTEEWAKVSFFQAVKENNSNLKGEQIGHLREEIFKMTLDKLEKLMPTDSKKTAFERKKESMPESATQKNSRRPTSAAARSR